MPGVYPPFLLKRGNRISEEMRKMGVAANKFLKGIKHKQIEIPANFIIRDLNNSNSSNFKNNLDHYLLQNFQIKHHYNHISIKKSKFIPSSNNLNELNSDNTDSSDSESSGSSEEGGREARQPLFTPAETRLTNRYLAPELYNEYENRIQTGMNKISFKSFCDLRAHSCIDRSRLSVKSQILLYIQRYRKAKPYRDLSVDFSLGVSSVFNIVEKLTFSEVKNSTNIPYYIQSSNIDRDVKTTMEFLGKECPPLLSNLAKEFSDPTGKNRKIAWGFLDATYLYMARSSNPLIQKITFCKFKGQNVLKVSAITTATGKIHLYYSFVHFIYVILT